MGFAKDATVDPRDLLLMVAEELGDLSASATSLQATLGGVLADMARAERGAPDMWHMQELDRLQQMLEDLSAILRHAAQDEGQRLDVERLAAVTRLGALRDRLRGARREGASGQEAGIVAIF